MEFNVIDSVIERLSELSQQQERFARKYGHQAAGFLDSLPALFRLYHRLTFDLDAPPQHRRKAASVAVYIAESYDFYGGSNLGVEALIDDIWLAYTYLDELVTTVPPDVLRRHWLSMVPFEHVCEMAKRIAVVEPHVPSRALGLLKTFLA
jgi:hypothetical protein